MIQHLVPCLLDQCILHDKLPEQLLVFTPQTLEVMSKRRLFLFVSLLVGQNIVYKLILQVARLQVAGSSRRLKIYGVVRSVVIALIHDIHTVQIKSE